MNVELKPCHFETFLGSLSDVGLWIFHLPLIPIVFLTMEFRLLRGDFKYSVLTLRFHIDFRVVQFLEYILLHRFLAPKISKKKFAALSSTVLNF